MKQAEIIKPNVTQDEAAATKKYQNFINYMELRELAGEDNEEITARNPAYQEDDEEEDLNPKSGSYYDPQRAAADLATTLSKTSKHIKKGQKKGNSIKEKEKARRMKGQSSISTWKPDLFMKMRQEYD